MHYLSERRTAGQDLEEEDGLTLGEDRLSASSRPPLVRIRNVGGHLIFNYSLVETKLDSFQEYSKTFSLQCRT